MTHLLAGVYVYELGLAQRLQVDAHVAVAFGRGVAAAPYSPTRGGETLCRACVGGLDKSIRVTLVRERHDVAHHKLDARSALQVLLSVDTAVPRRDVDVVHSVVSHNLTTAVQCKRRLDVRRPRWRQAFVLALLVQARAQGDGSCSVERADFSDGRADWQGKRE